MFIKTSDSRRKQTKFIVVALIMSVAIHLVLARITPNSSGMPGSQMSSRLNVSLSLRPASAKDSSETALKNISAETTLNTHKSVSEKTILKTKPLASESDLNNKEILTSHKSHNLASRAIQEKAKSEVHTAADLEAQPDTTLQKVVINTDITTAVDENIPEENKTNVKIEQVLDVTETAIIASQTLDLDSEKKPIKDNLSGSKLSAQSEFVRYQIGSNANPKPDYPSLAVRRGWQGEVVLGVHVRADGSIEHLTFVKSTNYGVLNYEAYETVRTSWHFKPLEDEEHLGEPAYIEVPIRFTLANR